MLCEQKDGISFQIEAVKRRRIRRFDVVSRTTSWGERTSSGPNDFFNGLLALAVQHLGLLDGVVFVRPVQADLRVKEQ